MKDLRDLKRRLSQVKDADKKLLAQIDAELADLEKKAPGAS